MTEFMLTDNLIDSNEISPFEKISSKFQNCLNMCVCKSPSKHCNMTM